MNGAERILSPPPRGRRFVKRQQVQQTAKTEILIHLGFSFLRAIVLFKFWPPWIRRRRRRGGGKSVAKKRALTDQRTTARKKRLFFFFQCLCCFHHQNESQEAGELRSFFSAVCERRGQPKKQHNALFPRTGVYRYPLSVPPFLRTRQSVGEL